MKNILLTLFLTFFSITSAFSAGMVGIKVGTGTLESTAVVSNDTDTTKDADSDYGAVFAEFGLGSTPLSAGIEYIPYTATVGVDGSKTDSHLELSDHTTLYLLASKELSNGASLYGKLGYSMADISAVTANYDDTTASSPDDKLEGPMVGLGVQSSAFSQFGMIARLEATWTEYDDVSVTTTENGITETKKATGTELTTLSISIAKQF